MTKEELKQYRKLVKEITYLEKELNKLYDKPVQEIAGKVQASAPEYPCIRKSVSVQMFEPKANAARRKTIAILEDRKRRCEKTKLEIERYIDKIKDSELRLIFRMRYVQGKKLKEIADALNQDLSGIGKKITAHLQLSNNSKKSML